MSNYKLDSWRKVFFCLLKLNPQKLCVFISPIFRSLKPCFFSQYSPSIMQCSQRFFVSLYAFLKTIDCLKSLETGIRYPISDI